MTVDRTEGVVKKMTLIIEVKEMVFRDSTARDAASLITEDISEMCQGKPNFAEYLRNREDSAGLLHCQHFQRCAFFVRK